MSDRRTTDLDERTERLLLGRRAVPLRIRRHARARKMSLRLDPAGKGVILTLPNGTPIREGRHFLREQTEWLIGELRRRPPRRVLRHGAHVPYLGEEHLIVNRPRARGVVTRENGRLIVSGEAEHTPRRVQDWLKRQARREVRRRARMKAARIGAEVGAVNIRDTVSQWGSCSTNGHLSFSWRLIMAPSYVLDYLVAHEVAHLREMNHGPRFWKLVGRLTADPAGARAWLREHGERLHSYG